MTIDRPHAAAFDMVLPLSDGGADGSESGGRGRPIFDALSIPALVCAVDTLRILDANPAALTRYGYSRDEVLARRLPDLHPPEDRNRLETWVHSLSAAENDTSEWRHVTHAGHVFDVELSCRPLSGARAELLFTAHDVTDRKGIESLFKAAADVSPNGMLLVEPSGVIHSVTRKIEEIFGYSESELLGRPIEFLIPAPARAMHTEHRVEFLHEQGPRRHGVGREVVGLHRSGVEIPLEVGLAPVTLRGQAYVAVLVMDIRERRAAEQSVRDAANRWHAVMNGAFDGVAILDRSGAVVEANLRMGEILGRTITDVEGMRMDAAMSAEDRALHARSLRDVLEQGTSRVLGATVVRPDGSRAEVDFALSPMEVGRERAILSIGRDVTEQRRLELQYRQAQKMEAIGRLAGGAAHDFNNILTAILGYVSLLADEMPSDGSAREDLDEIRKAADRAAGLTRQLLAFSRRQVLSPTVLSLNEVIADVQRMLERIIGEDVVLRTRVDATIPNVFVDRGQLEQILMNLAVNARDAMPNGGELTIETAAVEFTPSYATAHPPSAPGHYVMLAVTDTGVGMSEEVRARAFEPFFTTKEPGKGTGLGLSTVYGIVKQSDGFVWAYSEPGQGATFKVYFPSVGAPAARATSAPEVIDTVGVNETILLVEDDDALRSLTGEVLRRFRYTVVAGANAEEAMAISRRHPQRIALLLTDLVMPGASGRELAERLRAERPEVRILYMSGYTDDVAVRRGRLERGAAFVGKPFTPEALARRIRTVLDG